MTDVNLLLGLSNVVLIWITIYSAVIELKWRHEDRQKEAMNLKEKEKIVRDRLKTYQKRLIELETKVNIIVTALVDDKIDEK
jgi:hypothetical protein